jgi:hypothetical protein
MSAGLLGLMVWGGAAVALGVLIGKAIERADRAAEQQQLHRPPGAGDATEPSDMALWEAEMRHPTGREWTA